MGPREDASALLEGGAGDDGVCAAAQSQRPLGPSWPVRSVSWGTETGPKMQDAELREGIFNQKVFGTRAISPDRQTITRGSGKGRVGETRQKSKKPGKYKH